MSGYVTPLQAYLEQRDANQRTSLGNIQQAGALQTLLSNADKQRREAALRESIASSGGDVEAAMVAALKSGDVMAAHQLEPLVKMKREADTRAQTVEAMRNLNTPEQAPAQPQELGIGQPMAQPEAAPATPQDARQARIAKLNKLSELYATNPVVSQRIQAEIDRLSSVRPMVDHNFPVAENMVQPHISHDNGQTWQPILGSSPSPKFAKQVAPVVNVNAAPKPIGDFTKSGDEFLASIPATDRALVKKIANYDIDPKTLSTRGGQREKMLSLVTQYDPTYDDTQYANKRRAIAQFGSGPQGNTVRSLNVAIEHIDTLKRAADALKNGDFTPGNKAYNEIAKVFGSTPPNTFEGIRDMVANEVVKGTIGNAGALQDRAEAAAKVKAASSPQQLNDLMNGWTELMGGQVKGLERQYEASTKNKDFRERYLTPRTRDAIAVSESKAKATTTGTTAPPKNAQGWALMKDASGNQAYVSPDGKSFEEVK